MARKSKLENDSTNFVEHKDMLGLIERSTYSKMRSPFMYVLQRLLRKKLQRLLVVLISIIIGNKFN